MKKLMIAAAIVCAAVISQAADVRWNALNVSDSVDPENAYLANGCIGRLFNTTDVAIDVLSADLAKGDFTKWTTYGLDERAVSGGEGTLPLNTVYTSYTAGTYDWYAVILDADSTADAKNFYITNVLEQQKIMDGAGNETSLKFGSQETASMTGWQAISNVPEPTSGLLLLLGMAGLALRRRRA